MKINAHIPTQQYGYIEITNLPDDPATIEQLYNKYAEHPITLNATTKRLTDYFGNEIDYDKTNHIYSWKGEQYLSGSEYAKQFEKPFDKDKISVAMAKRDKRDQQDILDEWELNADVSRGFGTAVHAALELFGKYKRLPNHPVLKGLVEDFYEREKTPALYEVLVVDHKNKRAGRIDRLTKDRVQDFKTNGEITDKLPTYWKQLEFYSGLLEANNYPTKGLDIFHWDGKWTKYVKELKEVSNASVQSSRVGAERTPRN